MAIFQYPDLFSELLPDHLNHLFVERTGITHRRTLFDAGCKGYDLCPALYQQLGFQQHTFARATAAVGEANEFQLAIQVSKRTSFVSNGHKISCARTIVLGLHATDNAYFHGFCQLVFVMVMSSASVVVTGAVAVFDSVVEIHSQNLFYWQGWCSGMNVNAQLGEHLNGPLT